MENFENDLIKVAEKWQKNVSSFVNSFEVSSFSTKDEKTEMILHLKELIWNTGVSKAIQLNMENATTTNEKIKCILNYLETYQKEAEGFAKELNLIFILAEELESDIYKLKKCMEIIYPYILTLAPPIK